MGYFLDICCIKQDSIFDIKQGVMHLTEYILASKELIVLWTPRYSTRIWCLCELATFCRRAHLLRNLADAGAHEEAGRIVFLPLWLPPFAFAFSLNFLIMSILPWYASLVGTASPELFVVGLSLLCLALFTAIGFVVLYIQFAKIMAITFQDFSLDNAQAVSEEDRKLVLDYIQVTWSSAPRPCNGRDEFERFVRGELAEYVCEKHATLSAALRVLVSNTILVLIWQVLALALFLGKRALAATAPIYGLHLTDIVGAHSLAGLSLHGTPGSDGIGLAKACAKGGWHRTHPHHAQKSETDNPAGRSSQPHSTKEEKNDTRRRLDSEKILAQILSVPTGFSKQRGASVTSSATYDCDCRIMIDVSHASHDLFGGLMILWQS